MTLTFELKLDMLRPDLHAKVQVSMSVHSARIVRQTDRQTDRLTHDVKTITPSADAGCNKGFGNIINDNGKIVPSFVIFSLGLPKKAQSTVLPVFGPLSVKSGSMEGVVMQCRRGCPEVGTLLPLSYQAL